MFLFFREIVFRISRIRVDVIHAVYRASCALQEACKDVPDILVFADEQDAVRASGGVLPDGVQVNEIAW